MVAFLFVVLEFAMVSAAAYGYGHAKGWNAGYEEGHKDGVFDGEHLTRNKKKVI